VAFVQIEVGRTHTSRMLHSYCPICGLSHPALSTNDACELFRAAVSPDEESIAWLALKAAVVAVS
jgi:hypothetical protein